jgi:transposase
VIRAEGVRIWLATSPVDMRRSFDALAEHVRVILAGDPMSGHLFVFRNRTGQRVKILWWDRGGVSGGKDSDGGGYAIYYKRLERGTFQFPATGETSVAIGSEQLMKLLSGCSIARG